MDWIRENKVWSAILAIVIAGLIASVVVINDIQKEDMISNPTADVSENNGEDQGENTPEEPLTYTEISFLSTGDIMYHRPQIAAAYKNGSFDFSDNMKYIKPIVESVDFATANYETTLSDPNMDFLNKKQYPSFNAPVVTLDTVKDAGFDLLFYSNNHCYDYGHSGLINTMKTFDEKGMPFVGTRPDEESKSYRIVDVKGVKIGIINYMQLIGAGINGRVVQKEDKALIDTFDPADPTPMFKAIAERMTELNNQGADIIIVYMHWGEEYNLEPSSLQKEIAQKLCDMGVNVLLASHPHVIQPVEVLTSADGSNVMPCYYSMGNLISNQTRNSISHTNAIYTENGIMPILTIKKYSNGETVVSKMEYVSTWVHINGTYEIIPIENALNNPGEYGLSSSDKIKAAKEMTDGLVKAGVDQYNSQFVEPYPEAVPAA